MASSITSRLGTTPNESVKAPVRATSTTNITLAGEQTVATVPLVAGDRVLVAAQTDATENGIYDVTTGDWTRSPDWDASGDIVAGVRILDSSALVEYAAIFSGAFTLGTTEVTIIAISDLKLSDLNFTETGRTTSMRSVTDSAGDTFTIAVVDNITLQNAAGAVMTITLNNPL